MGQDKYMDNPIRREEPEEIIVSKKKETSTANVATFSHKLGGDPDEGFKDEEDVEELYKSYKKKKSKKKKSVKESNLEEGLFRDKNLRFDKMNLGQGYKVYYKNTLIGKLINRGITAVDQYKQKALNWIFTPYNDKGRPMRHNTATFYSDRDAFKMIKKDPMLYAQYAAVTEATTSGTNAGRGVAGTDTRFGAPSFEPVFFDEHNPDNDAIRNEKVFYKDENDPVLLPGWTYADDLEGMRFGEVEIEDNELDDEGVEMKMKKAVDWDLDFEGRYKDLLKRLRKAHNI
jgi:hypothetical protein